MLKYRMNLSIVCTTDYWTDIWTVFSLDNKFQIFKILKNFKNFKILKFKCTTDSCTAAFCEKGELLAHQTNHGEQKRITCNYSNHKLSGNITELTSL
jgi:hypothetical protein